MNRSTSFIFALPVMLASICGASLAQARFKPQPPASARRDQPALTWLAKCDTALGGVVPQDIRLVGTGTWQAPSGRHTGTVVLIAAGPWTSRVERGNEHTVSFTRDSKGQPIVRWSGSDRVAHDQSAFDREIPATWFFPAYLAAVAADASASLLDLGPAKWADTTVEHLRYYRTVGNASPGYQHQFEKLSQVEIYLDATTALPVGIAYAIRFDGRASRTLPVEVRFSDWQPSQAGVVPFKIERRINGGLDLSISISQVQTNVGLQPADFTLR